MHCRIPLLVCLVLIGCLRASAPEAGETALFAESGLPLTEIRTPGGQTLFAEVARTREDRIRGLQGRPDLPEGRGMLFVLPDSGAHQFWMQGMQIAIDIIFLDENRQVGAIFRSVAAPEASADYEAIPRVRAEGRYVLELRAGGAQASGIREGDVLDFNPITYPLE